MKITSKSDPPAILSSKTFNPRPDSDHLLKPKLQKPPRRKARNAGGPGTPGVRVRKEGVAALAGRRSRPETPLLRWKFDEGDRELLTKEERTLQPESGRRGGRKERGREKEVVVSSRKLAAALWWLQQPEEPVAAGRGGEGPGLPKNGRLGFQCGNGHIGIPFIGHHHNGRAYTSEAKDLIQSPCSISGPQNGYLHKFAPSFPFSNSAMEGATKWNPVYSNASDDIQQICAYSRHIDQQVNTVSAISALKVELEQAQACILDLETEKKSSKKKLEHFLRKLSEERAAWRNKEHEKIRAVIDDVKTDLNRERKIHRRLEIVNSKLVSDLADAKLSAKRYMQDYDKERKARGLIEEVCDELAKEIGEDKTEVEALKRESMKLREEVEDERKMLQMAEVWREERVQMKLVDAKVALEERYSQMNKLVAELEAFLSSRSTAMDAEEIKKAEFLRQAAASVDIQEIMEFTYEPPNLDDFFAVFEDVNFREANEREIEPCVGYSPANHASKIHTVSPEVNVCHKESMQRHANGYLDLDGDDVEEDGSGWETASHVEGQGSSFSPDGSDPSVNTVGCDSNVSGSRTEWEGHACEETPITVISEVCTVPKSHLKKALSISRLWRSGPNNGETFKVISAEGINGRLSNGRLSNGRLSNVTTVSPDRGSGKGRLSAELVGQWSSPESGKLHITRGMKGCIEWPRGMQRSSLKAKLLEARMDSQKIQLRQVLKQKI